MSEEMSRLLTALANRHRIERDIGHGGMPGAYRILANLLLLGAT